jgi:hypothetical protein
MPSTFFNVPSGAKAGYEVLQRLDYPTRRLRRRISAKTLEGTGVLIVLRPEFGFAREEVAVLEEWIDDGHALVVVPGEVPRLESNASLAGDDKYMDDWFAWKPDSAPLPQAGAFPSAERPSVPSEPETDSPLTEGLRELATPKGRRFADKAPYRGYSRDTAEARVFWKDQWGAIGLEAASGDGTIVALADEYPFTNVGLSEGDNGLLLANIARELAHRYPGEIAFDEYHLGMAERDVSEVAIAKLVFSGPWRWAAAQAALVGALALLAQAVRFGRPQDVVRKARRQHREFAEAAGRLLEEAGAASLAAATLYRYYRQRLCKLLCCEEQIDDRQLCEAVQRRAGPGASARLRQAQQSMHGPIGRQELLALAQDLHHIAEAIDHGT